MELGHPTEGGLEMSLHPSLVAPVEGISKAATVETGVIVFLRDLHTQLVVALQGAKANGATDEELKPLSEVIGALGVSREDVAKAFHGKAHGKTAAEEAAEIQAGKDKVAEKAEAATAKK